MTSKTEDKATAFSNEEEDKMELDDLVEAVRAASASRTAYRKLARTILKDLERKDSWQRKVGESSLLMDWYGLYNTDRS